jgi:hypothetical protein
LQGQSFVPVWPFRAGPRAGPSPLRSTSARRRRRRASPLRAARRYAPWARGSGSCPLSAGARRRRRGPSPRRAGRHSPLLFTSPTQTSPLYCAACAWSRWARRAGRRWLAATFAGGREGDVSRPPWPSPCRPVAMGSGGGTCHPLSLTRWAILSTSAGALRRRRGSSPRLAACASPPHPRSVDWDGFSASPTRHLHCAARAWSRWARRAGSSQPPLWGREGDASQAGPSPRGGAKGGRVPPSRLPAVRWW